MNKVIMTGRLCADPNSKFFGEDKSKTVSSFNLAVDRKHKAENSPTADFFSVSVFGSTAEFVSKYFKKGMKIAITGRLQNEEYTNKDGVKVRGTRIIADDVEFAESKKTDSAADSTMRADSSDGFMNIPDGIDDELPFA